MPTYLKQLGYSAFVVGVMYATLMITSIISRIVIGIIADKFKIQKLLFLVFMVSFTKIRPISKINYHF